MLLALAVIAAGLALRQIDRVHFARHRPHQAGTAELIALQRRRANDLTPLLLLAGQWLQITGWWLLTPSAAWAWAVTALAVAVHFRHLQEISHFAVHGVLARTPRANHLLAEVFAHHPLGLAPVSLRRRRHVRDHHPNATLTGVDPNLAELQAAGLQPGVTRSRFAAALAHPLTPSGLAATLASIGANLRHSPTRSRWLRTAALAAVPAAAYLAGGWSAVLFGVLIPRLLLYPQLAWMSLIVEHTWFDPHRRSGTTAEVEAGRCLRLYPTSRALAALAATTWLPYGDLCHYAHSAHPSVRWNYLCPLERHLAPPHFLPTGLLGGDSVTRRHYTALTHPTAAPSESIDAHRQPA